MYVAGTSSNWSTNRGHETEKYRNEWKGYLCGRYIEGLFIMLYSIKLN